jgi:alcohol dehydrogenase class IV
MAIREEVYGYFIPSVTLIGIGAAKQIPAKIKALGGSKPLIVTDQGITGAGITKQITQLLDEAAMKYVVYDETIPNPTDINVHDGVAVYKKNTCDSLLTLGGFYDLPHGECNAILLTHVSRFNLIAKMERFVKIAKLLGENVDGLSPRAAAELALTAIQMLSTDIGIPAGLIELGKRYGKNVRVEDIEIRTGNAQKDACGLTNPRCPKDSDVMAIYKAAL